MVRTHKDNHRSQDGYKNYYSKATRGIYHRDRSGGRRKFNSYTRGGYSYNNRHYYKKFQDKEPSPEPSPYEGSEEFRNKIVQTSALVMRSLLSPNEPMPSTSKDIQNDNEMNTNFEEKTNGGLKEYCDPITRTVQNKKENISSNMQKNEKSSQKPKKGCSQINVEEIQEKLMNYITNLNDGRKKNFINAQTTGLDTAIQKLQKQRRLEVSRVLRDMCSSSETRESSELFNSIIPDIGIDIEELPKNVIDQLRQTLSLDADEEMNNFEEDQMSTCSGEIERVDHFGPVKSEIQVDVSSESAVSFESSVEIKKEDVVDTITPLDSQNIPDLEIYVKEGDKLVTVPVNIKEEPVDEGQLNCPRAPSPCFSSFSLETVATPELSVLLASKDGHDENEKCSATLNKQDLNSLQSGRNQELQRINVANNVVATAVQTDSVSWETNCNFETTLKRFTENYGCDVSNLEEVSNKMSFIDQCVQNLTRFRQALFSAYFYSVQNFNNSTECPLSENVMSHKTSKEISPENRKHKRRKITENSEENTPADLEIKTEENQLISLTNLLNLHEVKEKVLVIQRVENELLLATASGRILFVSLKDSTITRYLHVTNVPITSIAFFRGFNDFIYLYVGSLSNVLKIYDLKRKDLVRSSPIADNIQCMDAMWDYVFMGCKNGTILRYSCKKNKIEFEEKNANVSILVLKATQEGPRKVLLVGHRNAPVFVRDAFSGLFLRNFSNEAVSPTVYAIVIDKNYLYCGTAKNNILVFSFTEGKQLDKLYAKDSKGITCMKVFKNLLFAGCYNGSIYIYSLHGKQLLKVLKGPGGGILSMEVLDNQIVVSTLSACIDSVSIPEELFTQ